MLVFTDMYSQQTTCQKEVMWKDVMHNDKDWDLFLYLGGFVWCAMRIVMFLCSGTHLI